MRRWVLVGWVLVAAVGCGPKSMKARRAASETRANQLDDALSRVEKAMAELDAKRAETDIEEARGLSQDPDLPLYPEYTMLTERLADDEKRLAQVRKLREKRDLDEAVAKQRAALEGPLATWKKAMVALDGHVVSASQVDDAIDAEGRLRKVLAGGAFLVEKDAGYTALAKDLRAQLEKAAPALTLATARASFLEGPGVQKAKAAAELKAGRASKKPDEAQGHGRAALDALKSCREQGQQLLKGTPGLGQAVVQVDSVSTTPESVVAWCGTAVKDAEKLVAPAPVSTKRGKARSK